MVHAIIIFVLIAIICFYFFQYFAEAVAKFQKKIHTSVSNSSTAMTSEAKI